MNFDDLLRKLAWYLELLRPLRAWSRVIENPLALLQLKVDNLMNDRGIRVIFSEDKMSAIPIAELAMGVCFDARPWTSLGEQ